MNIKTYDSLAVAIMELRLFVALDRRVTIKRMGGKWILCTKPRNETA